VDVDARLEALERENERLREENLSLKQALVSGGWRAPPEFRLTGKEARLLGCLLARDQATKDQLMTALYDPGIDDEPEIKIIDVFVCKLRTKLRPFGIPVRTIWGVGYALDAESKDAIRNFQSVMGAAA
jgi:two-component system, cell cycle response regulator CtrA